MMTDSTRSDLTAPSRMPGGPLPRFDTPLVPRNSISGRALVAVVSIMTFLASLTTGAVILVSGAASEWQSDVAREVTIQVIPAPGRDIDATVDKAAAVARAFPGIGDVRAYSKEESSKLLEPWLGSGLSLDELPVPRLIVAKISPGAAPDIPQFRRMLAEQVPAMARMRSIQPRWSSSVAPGTCSASMRRTCGMSGAAPGEILTTISRGTGNSSSDSPLPSHGSSSLMDSSFE